MKKLALLLAVLFLLGLFGLNFGVSSAYDSGCYGNNLYSTMTGRPCNASQYYNNYYGGNYNCRFCYESYFNDSDFLYEDFEIGDEGEDVKDLQRMLRDADFYDGRINGIYNSSTRRAFRDYLD